MDTALPVEPAPVHAADELLVGFARALRAAGVAVTMDRTQSFLAAAIGTVYLVGTAAVPLPWFRIRFGVEAISGIGGIGTDPQGRSIG